MEIFTILDIIFNDHPICILGSGENSGRSVTSVRLGQEFDVDVDAIAATMHQGQSKGT